MTDTKQSKQAKSKSGLHPLTVATAGVVVGAGVAIAGVVALKDKKNRKKVQDAFTNVKNTVTGYIENVQDEAEDKKEMVEKKIVQGTQKLKKVRKIISS